MKNTDYENANGYYDPRDPRRGAGSRQPRPQGPNPYGNGQNRAPGGYNRPGTYGQNQGVGRRRPAPQGNPAQRRPSTNQRPAQSTRRQGIRTYEDPLEKKRKKQFYITAGVLSVIALTVIIVIISALTVKYRGDDRPKPEDNTLSAAGTVDEVDTTADDTTAEPDPEPDPEPAFSYASRVSDTVLLGDEIDCKNAILIDVGTNTVIAEKGGDERIFPASMTKVMTVLVAVENCESLDETATVSNEVVAPLAAANATIAGLAPGDEVTIRDLVYGALLPSGADATGTLAEHIAGSEAAFAELMNKKCEELGLKNTHFVTASGLHDDNHYSTCHDMAIILQAAMANDFLREALGTADYTITSAASRPEGIDIQSTVFYRIDGSEEFDGKIRVIGGKTGYTGEAGQCLMTAAKVEGDDNMYVFVCAGGADRWKPVYDTIHVYRNYLGVKYDGEYVPKYLR